MLDIVAVINNKTLYACKNCGCHLFWDDEPEFKEWVYCQFCGWPINNAD